MRNLTKEEVKNIIESFYNSLKSLNLDSFVDKVCHSSTDFGNSSYLYIGPYKVRVSDHSVKDRRVLTELHLSDFNFNEVLEVIEKYFFPERFEQIETYEFGDVHERKESSLSALYFDYKIISGSERLSKKGEKLVSVQIKNKKVVSFKRIS